MSLTKDQIKQQLADTPGWEVGDQEIRRQFEFADFDEAMDFANHVATQATEQNHHPDILIQFNKVTIALSTHDAGGVTEKDIKLAKALDVEAL